MKRYLLRKNYTAVNDHVRAKLAFKTKDAKWLDTEKPVIILVSIHTAFHENLDGSMKMDSLVATIKNHVKGPITVLLADRAHIRTMSLKYPADGAEKCLEDARALNARFQSCFSGCRIAYWHSYIYQDENFEHSLERVKKLAESDPLFRECLQTDALSQNKHIAEFTDLFIEKSKEDILEQCACILVLSKKGYRFQFYPGHPYRSTEYVNQRLLPPENRVSWVNVFLSIESKKLLNPLTALQPAALEGL